MTAATAVRPSRPAPVGTTRQPPGRGTVGDLIAQYQPRFLRSGVLVSYIAVAALLYSGWTTRGQQLLTAESGLGYALGVIGGSMMLLLLLYPLRKKARFMRNFGPVKHWFRLHMTFGVLGPVCILYHCDFQLGSLNSNVALFCMLTVAGSGLIGRYLYMRIHNGLYGSKSSLAQLRRDADSIQQALSERPVLAPRLLERLDSFETSILSERAWWARLVRNLCLGLTIWRMRSQLNREVSLELREYGRTHSLSADELRSLRRSLRQHIAARLESARKIAGFELYERMFSAWHLLHLPLFLMLILSGVVHVFAVHIY